MATLLDRALKHNVVLDIPEEDYTQKKLALKKEIDRLTVEKRRRLPIETEVHKDIGERIGKLEEKLTHIHMADAGYPEQFSYQPLGWRYSKGADNKKGPRFQTQADIDKFLDYVRFLVGHLKGRVDYYTIWTEPEICRGTAVKCVNPVDYENMASQVIPVIREEDPDAKIILAPVVLRFGRRWLFPVLNSEVIGLFDVIDWHPFYSMAPDNEFEEYFYNYPLIIQDLKRRASVNGFQGEYWGTDMTWAPIDDPNRPSDEPSLGHTEIQNAKYWARMIVLELGMDVGVGVEGVHRDRRIPFETVRNLSTVMAGTSANSLPVEIESDATDILSYGFLLPNGDSLFALWTNGIALDIDPRVSTTLSFPNISATKVVAIDVLHGYEQEMIVEIENGSLVIHNLLITDYPIILRFSD